MHRADEAPPARDNVADVAEEGPQSFDEDLDGGEEGPESPGEPATAEDVRAYLARPETRDALLRRIGNRTPTRELENLVHDAMIRIMNARSLPRSRRKIAPWAGAIADRTVAAYYRKRAVRTGLDEVYRERSKVGTAPQREVAEAVILASWLNKAVANDPHDAETLDMIKDRALSGKTWGEVAAERDLTEREVQNRVGYFKEKIGPLRKKYLRRLALLGLLVLSAVALAAYLVLRYLILPVAPAAPPPPSNVTLPAPTPPAPTGSVFNQAAPPAPPPKTDDPKRP